MASLRRKPNSRYYIACFTGVNKKQLQRSTKTTDKKTALKLANEFEDAYRQKRTATQVRKVILDAHEALSGHRLESVTVRDYMDRWTNTCKGTVAPRTHEKYETTARQFISYLGTRADDDLMMVTRADIESFRDQVASRLSAGSANLARKIICVAFGKAVKDGIISVNPAERHDKIKVGEDKGPRRTLSVEEITRLLGAADEEWKGIILFGLYTGQRIGDIVRMTWQNVDLLAGTTGEIRFITQKTKRRMALPIHPVLRLYLENLPAGEDPKAPLFPKANAVIGRTKNGATGTLSNQFRDLLESVGMVEVRAQDNKKRGQGRNVRRVVSEVSFHCLRHTATTLLKSAGGQESVVKEIIGHSSDAVSRLYTHFNVDDLNRLVSLLPDVTAGKKKPMKNAS